MIINEFRSGWIELQCIPFEHLILARVVTKNFHYLHTSVPVMQNSGKNLKF